MLKKEVSGFNLDTIIHRINNDLDGFGKDIEAFSRQDLTLKQAKIDLDRKTLYSWKKEELLPYSTLKPGGKNKTWGRFSFIELCWIKMLIEMRSVGIGLNKLKEIKSHFFPENFLSDFFSTPVQNLESVNKEYIQKLEEDGQLINGQLQDTSETSEILGGIQFSLFSCIIYSAMLTKGNYVFWAKGNGQYDILNLNEVTTDPIKGIMELYKMLNEDTLIFVNIKKIIADLSDTHDYFSNDKQLSQSLSKDSVNIIKEIFKSGGVREVTIRVNNNGESTVWIRREMGIDDLEKEMRVLRKKGNYCDLAIKTRDGNIQYFEHTEIVKL